VAINAVFVLLLPPSLVVFFDSGGGKPAGPQAVAGVSSTRFSPIRRQFSPLANRLP